MPHEVVQTLSDAARQAVAQMARLLESEVSPSRLARVEIPVLEAEPLAWLRAQPGFTQYYWRERDGHFEMAGVGEADVLVPAGVTHLAPLFKHMRTQLSDRFPSLRYYGGLRFHRGPVKGDRWRAFKEYRFVVPRFELIRRGTSLYFACNGRVGHAKTNQNTLRLLIDAFDALSFSNAAPPAPDPAILSRMDVPNQQEWNSLISKTLTALDGGAFDKVVLARETCFTASKPFDPVALLSRLINLSPKTFCFCFHPAEDRAFIGASPERLYKRVNRYIQSEAVAGTAPRGVSDAQDLALGEGLLHSAKDRREQQFVTDMLHEHFQGFCYSVDVEPGPRLMRLRNCQHLCTRIEGLLHDAESDAALLEALHPTPAVGGCPRDRALAWIEREEPFDRGIYAAPTGWVSYDAAEFCVAIRSGLVQGNTLALYSGAGILSGSTADEEWAEIENKMANFLDVLHVRPAR